MYKVGFIGSQGVGKTSLATLVAGQLKRRGVEVDRIGEAATDAKRYGLPINQETTLQSQLWILHSWCAEDVLYSVPRAGGPRYDVILSDRGPENYCYLENKFGENPYALNIVLGHLELFPYDKLYFLPIVTDEIQANGVRDTNPDFQRAMQDRILAFLSRYNIRHTELPVPPDHDPLRDVWVKTVVNETLQALGRPEREMMR